MKIRPNSASLAAKLTHQRRAIDGQRNAIDARAAKRADFEEIERRRREDRDPLRVGEVRVVAQQVDQARQIGANGILPVPIPSHRRQGVLELLGAVLRLGEVLFPDAIARLELEIAADDRTMCASRASRA